MIQSRVKWMFIAVSTLSGCATTAVRAPATAPCTLDGPIYEFTMNPVHASGDSKRHTVLRAQMLKSDFEGRNEVMGCASLRDATGRGESLPAKFMRARNIDREANEYQINFEVSGVKYFAFCKFDEDKRKGLITGIFDDVAYDRANSVCDFSE